LIGPEHEERLQAELAHACLILALESARAHGEHPHLFPRHAAVAQQRHGIDEKAKALLRHEAPEKSENRRSAAAPELRVQFARRRAMIFAVSTPWGITTNLSRRLRSPG